MLLLLPLTPLRRRRERAPRHFSAAGGGLQLSLVPKNPRLPLKPLRNTFSSHTFRVAVTDPWLFTYWLLSVRNQEANERGARNGKPKADN